MKISEHYKYINVFSLKTQTETVCDVLPSSGLEGPVCQETINQLDLTLKTKVGNKILLKKGDIIANRTPNQCWSYITEDLNDYALPCSSFLLRPNIVNSPIPPQLLCMYSLRYGPIWSRNSNKIEIKAILNTEIKPWIKEDEEKMIKVLKTTLQLTRLHKKASEKLDLLTQCLAHRSITGTPFNSKNLEKLD